MGKQGALALAVAMLVAACGGNQQDSVQPQPKAMRAQGSAHGSGAAQQLPATAYYDAVQKIYIAYFGRPADPGGLASFAAQLAALGAPTDLAGLDAAYVANADLRQLIDAFSSSEESAALYASGDTNSFVTAVYYHLLNRAPDAEGLAYWANSINSNLVSKSRASLSIASGALENTSDQGKKDALLIGVKTAVSTAFTEAMQSSVGSYAGNTAAALARNMLDGLTASSSLASFQPVLTAVVDDMRAGNSATRPYPLLLNYITFLSRGTSVSSTVSVSCAGTSTSSMSAPVAATFAGQPALSSLINETMLFRSCTPSPYVTAYTQYYDANFKPLGFSASDSYAVFTTAPQTLPVHVAVGDSGSYGTQTVYADSTRSKVIRRDEFSYVIEADAGSGSLASAVFNLKYSSYDTAGNLTGTTQSRYRIGADGSVEPLSVDTVFAGDDVELLTKAQPTVLKVADTQTGTGAQAVAGKTATVKYTLWLYDASAAGTHGAQADSGTFSFVLGGGRVIAGFDQGINGMKVGGKRTLTIPASLGYGNTGSYPTIPGGAGLVFDVELTGVN